MAMTVDDDIYLINVGDSRAVSSKDLGKTVAGVTRDHKPMDPDEFNRIVSNGGKIYQSQTVF